MTTILFPENTRETINAIRGAIGRDVTFNTSTKVVCSACSIDPVTKTSTNFGCVVCSGKGYIYTFSGYTCSGHITYSPVEMMWWTTGGKTEVGDIRIQVEYTDTLVTILPIVEDVTVDGKNWSIENKQYRGVKEINRIIIDLKEKG